MKKATIKASMLVFLQISILYSNHLFAQKRVLSLADLEQWQAGVGNQQLSNDGKFLSYNEYKGQPVLHIRSLKNDWSVFIPHAYNCQMTNDNRRYIFLKPDSLGIGTLGSDEIIYLPGVRQFELTNKDGNANWLIFKKNGPLKDLTVYDLQSNDQKKIAHVLEEWLSPNDNCLALQVEDSESEQKLLLMDLKSGITKPVWKGKRVSSFVFSADGNECAFTATKDSTSQLFFYREGEKAAITLKAPLDSSGARQLGSVVAISSDGKRVFFQALDQIVKRPLNPAMAAVNVNSYKDPKLQAQQLLSVNSGIQYLASVNVSDGKVTLISDESHRLAAPKNADLFTVNTDHVLIVHTGEGALTEWNWNSKTRQSVYLLSLLNGKTTPISPILAGKNNIPPVQVILSPDGKFVIYYDPLKSNYFSYEINTGALRNLTSKIKTTWTDKEQDDYPDAKYKLADRFPGIFLNDGKSVLLYDRNDIYQVDMTGKQLSICLTGHAGKINDIVFGLNRAYQGRTLNAKSVLLLDAFSYRTKEKGFYQITLGESGKLKKLSMQACHFGDHSLVKARDMTAFALLKESATAAPNIFYSDDLIKFKQLTDVHPERQYNWLTSELITWKLPNGNMDQGILYKPENFDPNKKYPMIVHYYERNSDHLNEYRRLEFMSAEIWDCIPYFVSNGYLVFVPDIHFKVGAPGKSSMDCIVSGTKFLLQRNYVDPKRIGLQGHSWGGFQTNYVITHSHMFAAAMSSCGMSDLFSIYGSIIGGGMSRAYQYEYGKDRIGGTLWDVTNRYLANSPVLHANFVNTPILLVANKNDNDVPYPQGVEFFTALRRLGKKAWMLEYDGEGHGVGNKPNTAKDLTIRTKQFFDYYLKGTLPPIWMTKGVPANLKQIDDGLTLDTSGARP